MKLLSSCVLAVAALAVASLSQPTLAAETCGSGACLSNFDPVCGSDGKTYSNACELSRAKCTNSTLTLKSTGECAGSSTGSSSTGSAATCAQEFACMAVYDPVCGSDGKTYTNACELKHATCANPAVTLKSTGECSGSGSSSTGSSSGSGATVCKIKGCTKEYKPVCGSDNKSYANKCLFTNAQCETPTLTIKTEVACEGDDTDGSSSVGGDACVTMCTEEHKPVCGSNNLTYENACLLKNAQCANATITKTADSACPTAATPATGSAAESTAVAGIQVAALAVLSAVASLML